MLIFIDESGDPGLKINQGSSKFFTIALIVFDDPNEALACDQSISLLRKKLNWKPQDEFHFKRNSDKIRSLFLETVAPYNFFYYGISINKKYILQQIKIFSNKNNFYKYSCGLVFQNAKEQLENSIITIDESGNLLFKRQLARYLKDKFNADHKRIIKKIKMQRSSGNNLLQLADYVAGIINRKEQSKKKHWRKYYYLIKHREIKIEIWPK